ncbi:hypothetical protein ACFLYE_00430 [Chloroflexota bacterium]
MNKAKMLARAAALGRAMLLAEHRGLSAGRSVSSYFWLRQSRGDAR